MRGAGLLACAVGRARLYLLFFVACTSRVGCVQHHTAYHPTLYCMCNACTVISQATCIYHALI